MAAGFIWASVCFLICSIIGVQHRILVNAFFQLQLVRCHVESTVYSLFVWFGPFGGHITWGCLWRCDNEGEGYDSGRHFHEHVADHAEVLIPAAVPLTQLTRRLPRLMLVLPHCYQRAQEAGKRAWRARETRRKKKQASLLWENQRQWWLCVCVTVTRYTCCTSNCVFIRGKSIACPRRAQIIWLGGQWMLEPRPKSNKQCVHQRERITVDQGESSAIIRSAELL